MNITPSKPRAVPQTDNSIQLGRYFYGIHCPHCKDMSPFIDRINQNVVGGWIWPIATDDVWETPHMKHESLSSKLSPRVKESMKDSPIEVTPTIIWGDDIVTKGAPYDGHDIASDETLEYLCIRAAKSYLKQADPGIHREEVQGIIDQVFDGRFVMEQTESGYKRVPEKGLREITRRY